MWQYIPSEHKNQPHGGTGGQVRDSVKPVGFILWGPWISWLDQLTDYPPSPSAQPQRLVNNALTTCSLHSSDVGLLTLTSVSEWLVCVWLCLSWTKYPGGMTGCKGGPRIFIYLTDEQSPDRWGWMRHRHLHMSRQIQQHKTCINCHANERQMRFKPR